MDALDEGEDVRGCAEGMRDLVEADGAGRVLGCAGSGFAIGCSGPTGLPGWPGLST
jgi:hypothetical protein